MGLFTYVLRNYCLDSGRIRGTAENDVTAASLTTTCGSSPLQSRGDPTAIQISERYL